MLRRLSIAREQVDRFVLDAVAQAAGVDAASLRQSTPLIDTHMDSLTLVAVVTQAEAAYGAAFGTDELAEILRARTVGELSAIVARKLRAS